MLDQFEGDIDDFLFGAHILKSIKMALQSTIHSLAMTQRWSYSHLVQNYLGSSKIQNERFYHQYSQLVSIDGFLFILQILFNFCLLLQFINQERIIFKSLQVVGHEGHFFDEKFTDLQCGVYPGGYGRFGSPEMYPHDMQLSIWILFAVLNLLFEGLDLPGFQSDTLDGRHMKRYMHTSYGCQD